MSRRTGGSLTQKLAARSTIHVSTLARQLGDSHTLVLLPHHEAAGKFAPSGVGVFRPEGVKVGTEC